MRLQLLFVTALALAALAVAAGCGGDDEQAATAGTSKMDGTGIVSKQEFIDQANSLCAARSAELKVKGKKVFKEVFEEPEAVAAKKMVDEVIVPVFEGELRDLKTLNVPDDGNREVVAIYAAIEEMIKKLKVNPKAGDFYPYTEAEKLAAAYGVTACGHP